MKFLQKLKERLWSKIPKTEPSAKDGTVKLKEMFGPFAPAFLDHGLSVPGYMILLNLNNRDGELKAVLNLISESLNSPDAEQWHAPLLENPDWRPHLVGALAALLAKDPAPFVPLLWHAIDAGSWVTPQLVATARLVSPDFYTQAISRVEAGCPVTEPQGLSMLARHSATGPAGTAGRQGKLIASLLAVCDKNGVKERIRKIDSDPPDATLVENLLPLFEAPEVHVWAQLVQTRPDVVAILAEDFDNSDEITLGWLAQVQAVLHNWRNK